MTSWSTRLLAPFQRQTSSGRYLPEIDGLRCLAVFLVVLFHSHGFFTSGNEPSTVPELLAAGPSEGLKHIPHAMIGRGWFGVQIFFLISGLVLALPYAAHYLHGEERPLVKKYFKRRLIRIEIPYIIALTFFYILSFTLYQNGFMQRLPNYAVGLIYAHGLVYDGQHNPLLFVAWTLEIEVQFYLLVPLLCRIFALPKIPRRALLIIGILSIDQLFGGSFPALNDSILQQSVFRQLNWFLPGLLLADLYLSPGLCRIRDAGGTRWADLLGIPAWLAVFTLIDFHFSLSPRPFVLLAAFWCILAGPTLGRIFRNRWLTAIGMMCYTIYLFHNFFIHTFFGPHIIRPLQPYLEGNWPLAAIFICAMAVIIIILCGFIYLLVERPFARGKLPWKKAPPAS